MSTSPYLGDGDCNQHLSIPSSAKRKRRYQCSRCGKIPVEAKAEHLLKCNSYRCGRCWKCVCEPREQHNAKCTGKKYQCFRCIKYPSETKEEHYKHCTGQRYQCNRCLKHPLEPKRDHKAKCPGQRYLCHRCGKFPHESKKEHYRKCSGKKYQCHRCAKYPSEPKAEHFSKCRGLRYCCSRCGRYPKQSKEEHRKICKGKRHHCDRCYKYFEVSRAEHSKQCHGDHWKCNRCGKRPREGKREHYTKCSFWVCTHCGAFRIPKEQRLRHVAGCAVRRCPLCRKRFDGTEMEKHVDCCPYEPCLQCNRPVLNTETEQHLQICSFYSCQGCRQQIPREEMPEHRTSCFAAVRFHRQGRNWSPQVIKTILGPTIHFPVAPGVRPALKAFSKNLLNTGVIDFEFFCVQSLRLFPGYPQIPFHVAMSNARGDWIIPATTINYNVSVKSMLEEGCALRSQQLRRIWESKILRYYGAKDLERITPGLTWREIAERIDAYTQENGKLTMLFGWAPSNLDYTLLAKGLELARRQDLLPPEPVAGSQPFWWWATLRRSLGATTDEMSLCLGRVYGSLYPEDRRLPLRAHTADADVVMLRQVVRAYLARVQGLPAPGKIEASWLGYLMTPEQSCALEARDEGGSYNEHLLDETMDSMEQLEEDLLRE